jgi:hypothetical protein
LSRLDRFIGEVDPNLPRQARAPADMEKIQRCLQSRLHKWNIHLSPFQFSRFKM